jgi:hypothetical protein
LAHVRQDKEGHGDCAYVPSSEPPDFASCQTPTSSTRHLIKLTLLCSRYEQTTTGPHNEFADEVKTKSPPRDSIVTLRRRRYRNRV